MSVIKNNKTYGIRVKLLQPEPMPEPIHAETYFYVEDIIGDGMTCSVSAYSTLQYSTDGTNWQTIQISDTTEQLSVPAKGRLYMYGSGENYRIKCNAPFNTGGNIMSLFYGNDFQGHTESVNLNNLFENSLIYKCKTVFPSTTVGGGYYQWMFYGCASLTTAPELPATTLDNYAYAHLFHNCTSLTTAPALPATTLAENCYSGMFEDCTALTTAPVLPATTLAEGCYHSMFWVCTSLNRVTTYATDISASYCLNNWLYRVSSTGDFYNLGRASYRSGANGIPTGWTEHTSL